MAIFPPPLFPRSLASSDLSTLSHGCRETFLALGGQAANLGCVLHSFGLAWALASGQGVVVNLDGAAPWPGR